MEYTANREMRKSKIGTTGFLCCGCTVFKLHPHQSFSLDQKCAFATKSSSLSFASPGGLREYKSDLSLMKPDNWNMYLRAVPRALLSQMDIQTRRSDWK